MVVFCNYNPFDMDSSIAGVLPRRAYAVSRLTTTARDIQRWKGEKDPCPLGRKQHPGFPVPIGLPIWALVFLWLSTALACGVWSLRKLVKSPFNLSPHISTSGAVFVHWWDAKRAFALGSSQVSEDIPCYADHNTSTPGALAWDTAS